MKNIHCSYLQCSERTHPKYKVINTLHWCAGLKFKRSSICLKEIRSIQLQGCFYYFDQKNVQIFLKALGLLCCHITFITCDTSIPRVSPACKVHSGWLYNMYKPEGLKHCGHIMHTIKHNGSTLQMKQFINTHSRLNKNGIENMKEQQSIS